MKIAKLHPNNYIQRETPVKDFFLWSLVSYHFGLPAWVQIAIAVFCVIQVVRQGLTLRNSYFVDILRPLNKEKK